MNRTRQYLIIGVLIVAIGAFVLGPLLRSNSKIEDPVASAAVFNFAGNRRIMLDRQMEIGIKLPETPLVKMELYFQDSLLKSWDKPKGDIRYVVQTGLYGVGARSLSLISTDANGREFNDSRIIQVISDVAPTLLKAEIVKTYNHNPTSFTQGLEFHDGVLYESTGQKGSSFVARVDLESGKIKDQIGLDANYFGEGITILNNRIYQLTWQEQKCFYYDLKTLQIQGDFPYTGEGWGICNNGSELIMSNGTEVITFRDPKNFQILRTIEVYDQVGPKVRLNELEYIDGKIYANVWMSDYILVIDPKSGKVLSEIDCNQVAQVGRDKGEVLNGIAWNSANKKLYLTGKNWAKLIEVSVK